MYTLVLLLCAQTASEGQLDAEKLLQFIAATQFRTSSEYATLSYDVVALNTSYIPAMEKPVPVSSRYNVRRRSTSILLTWESQTTIRETSSTSGTNAPKIEITTEPRVTKILKTETYIAQWMNVAIPDVQLYLLDDWENELTGYGDKSAFYHRPVDVSTLCFGYVTPFHELLASGDLSRWKMISFDPSAGATIERMVPGKDGQYSKAMTLELNGPTGAVVQAEFFPAKGTVTVDYSEMVLGARTISLPIRYVFRSGGTNVKTQNEVVLQFANYSDESKEPPYMLRDLGVPSGTRILRSFPDSRVQPIVWDGQEPSSKIGRSAQ